MSQTSDNMTPGSYSTTVTAQNTMTANQIAKNKKEKVKKKVLPSFVTHEIGSYILEDFLKMPNMEANYQLRIKPKPDECSVDGAATEAPKQTKKELLKSGSKGKPVEEAQKALGIKADGKYGPKTRAAVIKFQKDNGLKPDGVIGSKTSAKLEATAKAKKKGIKGVNATTKTTSLRQLNKAKKVNQ